MTLDLLPTDPIIATDPYPAFAHMRETGPMHFDPDTGRWYVFSHAEGLDTFRQPDGDNRWLASQNVRLGRDASEEPYVLAYRDFVNMKSGADHRRVRRVIAKHFRPDRVAKLRPDLVKRADDLLDGFAEDGSVELLQRFAQELPLGTICQLLGVDLKHREKLVELLSNFKLPFLIVPMSEEHLTAVNTAMIEVQEFFGQLIAERRANMGDDLLSALITEADAGNLTESELLANTWGAFAGGFDTTSVSILNSVIALTENPDQIAVLQNNWELLPNAVEECLRYNGSGGSAIRIFTEDKIIGGHEIPKDTPVAVYKQSANRDAAWIADADVFDVSREPTEHFTFGEGLHKCLGLNLAKQTIGVALEVLFSRLQGVQVTDNPIDWNFAEVPLRNPKSLNISWTGSVSREAAGR